jgi:predicted polyphosphate/ATP-dependent NAD kinase
MKRSPSQQVTVGIVANPASGRDIRRLVARASVFPIAEKCNMIIRLLAALGATGVERVLMMPDVGGVSERLRRAIISHEAVDAWPEVEFLDMPVDDGPTDTVRAVEHMVAAKVSAIVVLGGDGTHRLVATACEEIPLMGLSTGTNNVFPEMREATVAGIATGLIATGQITKAEGTMCNKVLRVEVNGLRNGLALVDASVSSEWWIGAKALWHPERLSQIFVTFAEPDAIGLSAVAGLLCPVSRSSAHGLRVDLVPPETAPFTLKAPIAPGLVVSVGVAGVREIHPGEPQAVTIPQGVVALDGEREIEFQSKQQINLWLDRQGPLTIDVERVMALAARDGLLIAQRPACEEEGESFVSASVTLPRGDASRDENG